MATGTQACLLTQSGRPVCLSIQAGITLNQINKLVILCVGVKKKKKKKKKKESKVPVLNNGCNPVLSISSKKTNSFRRTTVNIDEKFPMQNLLK